MKPSPRFSRLRGRLRIGPDFFARRGYVVAGEARGVIDRIADLAHPGIDVARVHPAIVAFFEDTAGLELLVRSRWRWPVAWAWWLWRWVMRAIGQFVLPMREARIATAVHALDAAADGRPGARAVVRTYADTGRVMQAVAYATWTRGDRRYMSAAFPMPLGQIAGILRLDALAEETGCLAIELTSRRQARDDAGVWFVLGPLAIRSPFGERLRLWSADMRCAPPALAAAPLPGATIVGEHIQTLFGFRFVTHHYWFRPGADRALPSRT